MRWPPVFYAARGIETTAHLHLRNARSVISGGAPTQGGAARSLYPHLRDAPVPASATATIGTPVERLDVGTVVKASQAVSGEIELGELIKTLLRISVEHAGASVACSSCSKATSPGSRRKRRPAAARLRSRCTRRPRHRPNFPNPCSTL